MQHCTEHDIVIESTCRPNIHEMLRPTGLNKFALEQLGPMQALMHPWQQIELDQVNNDM